MGTGSSSVGSSRGSKLSRSAASKRDSRYYAAAQMGKMCTWPDGRPGYITTRSKAYYFTYGSPMMEGIADIFTYIAIEGRNCLFQLIRVNKRYTSLEDQQETENNVDMAYSAMKQRKGDTIAKSARTRADLELELDADEFYHASKIKAESMLNNSSVRRPILCNNTKVMRIAPMSAGEAYDGKKNVRTEMEAPDAQAETLQVEEMHTWAFFNDTIDKVFHVRAILDSSCEIVALKDTIITKGVSNEIDVSTVASTRQFRREYYQNMWIAETVVPPLTTISFIEGKIKGAYIIQCELMAPNTNNNTTSSSADAAAELQTATSGNHNNMLTAPPSGQLNPSRMGNGVFPARGATTLNTDTKPPTYATTNHTNTSSNNNNNYTSPSLAAEQSSGANTYSNHSYPSGLVKSENTAVYQNSSGGNYTPQGGVGNTTNTNTTNTTTPQNASPPGATNALFPILPNPHDQSLPSIAQEEDTSTIGYEDEAPDTGSKEMNYPGQVHTRRKINNTVVN